MLPLIASLAGGLNADQEALERIRDLCRARRRDAPEDFLLTAGLAVVRAAQCPPECAKDGDCEFGRFCRHMESNAAANLAELGHISRELSRDERKLDGPPVLLGGAAVLVGLYHSLEAFRSQVWVIGVKWREPHGVERSATTEAVASCLARTFIGHLGRLEPLVDEHTDVVELAGGRWRVPRRDLFTALLAARVGEPVSATLPPVWVHLAVALEAWREKVDYDQVFDLADRLAVATQVRHGLAVTAAIMPHLRTWIPMKRLQIPFLERTLAVPLAARRLLDTALRASPAFGPDGHAN